MARVGSVDRAKLKAKREKQIAAVLGVVLIALLAIEGPKTLKQLQAKPAAPVVAASAVASTTPVAVAAAPTPSAALVSAVQPSVDAGQLRTFTRFASKDPFKAQVSAAAVAASSGAPPAAPKKSTAPQAVKIPPPPPPTSAVISVNGELGTVLLDTDFPTAGTVFSRIGAVFHLVALTRTSAKVTINGGSYASGTPALTLTVGKPVTLQNTADGTRYTLLLEPPTIQVPTAATTTTTATTPPSVVPSTGP